MMQARRRERRGDGSCWRMGGLGEAGEPHTGVCKKMHLRD